MNKNFNKEPYIIYGGMGLGGEWGKINPLTEIDYEEGRIALDTAIECGINFIDLADIYREGKSELVVGNYLKSKPGLREKLIIQSKVGIHLTGAEFGSRFDFSYKHIISSVDQILERIGTDYLDILLLHRPDPLLDRDEIKKAIDELFDSGKIRDLGVSNMDHHQIQLLEAYTGRKMVANQLELSLLKTDFISSAVGFNNYFSLGTNFPLGTIEHSILKNISLQSWSPIAQGIYTGKKLDKNTPQTVINTKKIVERLAKEKNVSTDAIVIAWLMKHPAKINPVIGSKNPQRIKNAVEAYSVELSRDEWYELVVSSTGKPMP